MPKPFTLQKNFKRFKASKRYNLLALQAFSYGLYNARLKLKTDKVRYHDLLTVLIVGEMKKTGCKVSDFCQILGYQTSTSRIILKRAASRRLIKSCGGRTGRGKAAIFELTIQGERVYSILQKEIGETLNAAMRHLTREIVNRLHK